MKGAQLTLAMILARRSLDDILRLPHLFEPLLNNGLALLQGGQGGLGQYGDHV